MEKCEENLKKSMFESILQSKNVFYKSQQIGDAEITQEEKTKILEELFDRNHVTFLSRYGKYLMAEHLKLFEDVQYEKEEECFEVQHYLKQIREQLKNRDKVVRNRRFTALKQMIKDDADYFSESEMMRRNPKLYENLVGQYMTEEEKWKRDMEEVHNISLVNVLLRGIDEREEARNAKLVEQEEEMDSDDDESPPKRPPSREKTPEFSRKQWGNFEIPETSDPSRERIHRMAEPEREPTEISEDEKVMLREEFADFMYSSFLAGNDNDFDYAAIDEDDRFDDESQQAQDSEDKYFDSEDAKLVNEDSEGSQMNGLSDQSEDDELDKYMRSLKETIHQENVASISNRLKDEKMNE